jgi:3-isopropylmalate/(R)-2-methylmalate dehydratase large subunit
MHNKGVSRGTITAQILEQHGIEDGARAGAFGLARCDLVMINEISGVLALRAFAEMGAERVFDPSRVAIVCDHFVPAKDARSAEMIATMRRFAREQGIEHFWEAGSTPEAGIEHTLLPEQGLVRPGDFIPGGDSHTCTYGAFGAFGTGMGSTDMAAALALGEVWIRVPETERVEFLGAPGSHVTGKDLILAYIGQVGVAGATYRALEFGGDAVRALGVDGRMALCNMAVEAGAKTGLVAADETTLAWLADRVAGPPPQPLAASDDAVYHHRVTVDVEGMGPLLARPHSPGDVIAVADAERGTHVDQVYVGNCANGTITDLRQLAEILAGHRVARDTRLIVVPATQRIYRQALHEGLIDVILDAGGLISPPTCGACYGGHMGIIGPGETAVATTNRNFRGRMGHRDSRVFLANAYVAGAVAVAGEIVSPAAIAPAEQP